MAFELKVLEKVSCPRCNGKAELRIDQKKNDTRFILVYTVCNVCKLNRYSHTTTRKEIKTQREINKLKEMVARNHKNKKSILARIEKLKKLRGRMEV